MQIVASWVTARYLKHCVRHSHSVIDGFCFIFSGISMLRSALIFINPLPLFFFSSLRHSSEANSEDTVHSSLRITSQLTPSPNTTKRIRHHQSPSALLPDKDSPVRKEEGSQTDSYVSSKSQVVPQINVLDVAPVPNFNFKHTCTVRETHGRSVFGIAFNSINRSRPSDPLLFATVAAHLVTIYQCNLKSEQGELTQHNSDSPPIVLLQSFTDPAGDEEEFYCCAWSRDTSGNVASSWWTDCAESGRARPEPHPHQAPIKWSSVSLLPPHQQLVAAAVRASRELTQHNSDSPPIVLLQSFTDPAGDEEEFYCCAWSRDTSGNVASSWWTDCAESGRARPEPHPHQAPIKWSSVSLLPPHQQLVAAADYTIRLWNIASHVLVCIFGGAEGHRAEVLHGDLSLTGDLLLTSGMDHCIKIWRLNTPELANAVIDSFSYRIRANPK
ncbi:hypothetical protein AHF37_07674 [Paragonimus kellicotti]|nr:hypothetical protein AHF37_07674 [Paragonimus kellicotti]